jgi:predicted small lipoprotein YifL
MRRLILPMSLFLVLAALAGCGNKGPLVPAPPKPQPAKASTTVKPPVVKPSAVTPPAVKPAEPAYGSSSDTPASAQS